MLERLGKSRSYWLGGHWQSLPFILEAILVVYSNGTMGL